MTHTPLSVVMIGGTGAVGGHAVRTLLQMPEVEKLTLLGRRPVDGLEDRRLHQVIVDVLDPSACLDHLAGHNAAVCTLGVGQPSEMSPEEFLRIDRDAVLAFGRACREAGVTRFSLLGSVGASPTSPSFFLRAKGELEEGLKALGFEALNLFRPSMILTPTNRYGVSQAITLAVWPALSHLMIGPLSRFRGIRVDRLGRAMGLSLQRAEGGVRALHWREITALASGSTEA